MSTSHFKVPQAYLKKIRWLGRNVCLPIFLLSSVSILTGCPGVIEAIINNNKSDSDNASEQPTATTSTPQVALAGNPNDLAKNHIQGINTAEPVKDSEISTENGLKIARTQFEIAFQEDVTVGKLNEILASIDAKIISSLEGIVFIVVQVPDKGSLTEMRKVIDFLESLPEVQFVREGHILEPAALPPNISPLKNPDGSYNDIRVNVMAHLAPSRVPAMWNAMSALESQDLPLLLIEDWFGDGYPDENIFSIASSNRSDFKDSPPHTHGYMVLSVIAAKYTKLENETSPEDMATGIWPVKLFALQASDRAYRRTEPAYENYLLDSIANVDFYERPIIVNSSLGYSCGRDAECRIKKNTDRIRQEGTSWIYKVRNYQHGNLENKFFHTVAAGNNGENPSDWGKLADRSGSYQSATLRTDRPFPPLNNTLVVEALSTTLPDGGDQLLFEADEIVPRADFSDIGGQISAPGDVIWMISGPQNGAKFASGTSFASPYVAGIIGAVWSMVPELNPVQVKRLILETSRPGAPGSAPIIDAYAALLATDYTNNLEAPVRNAILDINNDMTFTMTDVQAFLAKIGSTTPESRFDFSRFDLNGDGHTGGIHTMAFDLNLDDLLGLATVRIGGSEKEVDEKAVTDLDILCYYAANDEYFSGDTAQRDALIKQECFGQVQLLQVATFSGCNTDIRGPSQGFLNDQSYNCTKNYSYGTADNMNSARIDDNSGAFSEATLSCSHNATVPRNKSTIGSFSKIQFRVPDDSPYNYNITVESTDATEAGGAIVTLHSDHPSNPPEEVVDPYFEGVRYGSEHRNSIMLGELITDGSATGTINSGLYAELSLFCGQDALTPGTVDGSEVLSSTADIQVKIELTK